MCVEDAGKFSFLHSPAETGTFERASESPLRGVIWSMSEIGIFRQLTQPIRGQRAPSDTHVCPYSRNHSPKRAGFPTR
jgi:hypothetical protein